MAIQFFRNTSIKNKLSLIILLTSSIVLMLASSAFVINELVIFKRSIATDLLALAELMSINMSAPLTFEDVKAADENIGALKAKPRVIFALVFDKEGKIFSKYLRKDIEKDDFPPHSTLQEYYAIHPQPGDKSVEDSYFFQDDYVEVFRKSIFQKDQVGTVYIRSDLRELQDRLYSAAGIVLTVMLTSLILAFILAALLQRIITLPIYQLRTAMQTISSNRNYTLRVDKMSADELGDLTEGFNEMLTQIEIRDRELNQYRNHLEEKVEQRTSELAEARDQALAANKAKSIFLANMSHEIRTPMNAVLGYAQILRRDKSLTKEQRDTLHIIENSGNHLLGLINDILDISKIEAGAMELRPENFYLNNLIDGISAMFKIRCEQKQLGWRVEVAIEPDTLVYADQGKLRQILINLLGNAVKFTEDGEVMLRVSYTDAAEYRFDIIDTGQGISPDSQQAIFEPFQQAKAGFDKGGTGLGLAITKRQLELMGGRIQLISQVGKGSCFSVFLPLEIGEGEVFAYDKTVQISHLAPGHSVNALAVDDVQENRDILSYMLTEIGITVQTAVDGKGCLHKLHQEPFDIVFMDIRMPVMDGMECMAQIIQQFPEKRPVCIAISASTLQHQSKEVLNAGFDHFISKPFRFEAIYECLIRFLAVQFEYKESTVEATDEDTQHELDLSSLSLPENLYRRLKEAAELNELTELEAIVAELRNGDVTQKQLADSYQEMLSNYNIDGILETLEKIGCTNGR